MPLPRSSVKDTPIKVHTASIGPTLNKSKHWTTKYHFLNALKHESKWAVQVCTLTILLYKMWT